MLGAPLSEGEGVGVEFLGLGERRTFLAAYNFYGVLNPADSLRFTYLTSVMINIGIIRVERHSLAKVSKTFHNITSLKLHASPFDQTVDFQLQ